MNNDIQRTTLKIKESFEDTRRVIRSLLLERSRTKGRIITYNVLHWKLRNRLKISGQGKSEAVHWRSRGNVMTTRKTISSDLQNTTQKTKEIFGETNVIIEGQTIKWANGKGQVNYLRNTTKNNERYEHQSVSTRVFGKVGSSCITRDNRCSICILSM